MINVQTELAERALELLALPIVRDGDDERPALHEDDSDRMSWQSTPSRSTDSDVTCLTDDEQTSPHRDDHHPHPKPSGHLLLDIGVGSGLCASVLEAHGHHWLGL